MDQAEIAQKCADIMWQGDKASLWFGMKIDRVDAGTATLSLIVQKHHANGHGICHGGVTFALADSAFAFACNSRNQATVGQHTFMSYLAPAHVGDTLFAQATEVSLKGRSGIYDVEVTNQDEVVIAQFRGCSRAINKQLYEE